MFAMLDGFQKPSKVLRVHEDSFLVSTTKTFRSQGHYYKLQTYEAAANIHVYFMSCIFTYAMTERKSLKTMALSPKFAAGQLKNSICKKLDLLRISISHASKVFFHF